MAHAPKPDVQKLRSNPDLKQIWCQEVERKLQETKPPLHGDPKEAHQRWEILCRICREVATQVCGVLTHFQGKPWLRNREEDIKALDQAIAAAKVEDRQARMRQGTFSFLGRNMVNTKGSRS